MKYTRNKKSKRLLDLIAERFSYKQRPLIMAISLFAAAGALSYINSGSYVLLAAPPFEIISKNHLSVKFLIEIFIGVASFIVLTSISQKDS